MKLLTDVWLALHTAHSTPIRWQVHRFQSDWLLKACPEILTTVFHFLVLFIKIKISNYITEHSEGHNNKTGHFRLLFILRFSYWSDKKGILMVPHCRPRSHSWPFAIKYRNKRLAILNNINLVSKHLRLKNHSASRYINY